MGRVFESHRLHISAFFREKKNGNTFFASVCAGDVNGYDSLLPSTTVVRGKWRAPGIPVPESVTVNWRTCKKSFYWLDYIAPPTEPSGHMTLWFGGQCYIVQPTPS